MKWIFNIATKINKTILAVERSCNSDGETNCEEGIGKDALDEREWAEGRGVRGCGTAGVRCKAMNRGIGEVEMNFVEGIGKGKRDV